MSQQPTTKQFQLNYKNPPSYIATDEFGDWWVKYYFIDTFINQKDRRYPAYDPQINKISYMTKLSYHKLEKDARLYSQISFKANHPLIPPKTKVTFIQIVKGISNNCFATPTSYALNDPQLSVDLEWRDTYTLVFNPSDIPRVPYIHEKNYTKNGKIMLDAEWDAIFPIYHNDELKNNRILGEIVVGDEIGHYCKKKRHRSTMTDAADIIDDYIPLIPSTKNKIVTALNAATNIIERKRDSPPVKEQIYLIPDKHQQILQKIIEEGMVSPIKVSFETAILLIQEESNNFIILNSLNWGFSKKQGVKPLLRYALTLKKPSSEMLQIIYNWNLSTLYSNDEIKGCGKVENGINRVPIFLSSHQEKLFPNQVPKKFLKLLSKEHYQKLRNKAQNPPSLPKENLENLPLSPTKKLPLSKRITSPKKIQSPSKNKELKEDISTIRDISSDKTEKELLKPPTKKKKTETKEDDSEQQSFTKNNTPEDDDPSSQEPYYSS